MIKRRAFLERMSQAIVVLPLTWMGAAYLFPSLFRSQQRITKVALGTTTELFKDRRTVVTKVGNTPAVVMRDNDHIHALSMQCTHAQCTVQLADDQSAFVCPCHGGSFHLDGSVRGGPPQRPLRKLFVSVHDDVVYLSDRVVN